MPTFLKFKIPTLLIASLFTFCLFFTQVHAQEITEKTLSCPINSNLEVSFLDLENVDIVDDAFSSQIYIENNSQYYFSGIRVGLGVYGSDLESIPLFWTLLPDKYQLSAGEKNTILPNIDVSSLRAGEYIVKPFIIQGDETAVLGAMIRDVDVVDGVPFTKTSIQTNNIDVEVVVNQELYKGSPISISENVPIEFSVKSTNNNSVPLLENKMLAVITQGSVPLGTAVKVGKLDQIKLIPGARLITKVKDNFVEGGIYTAYAGLMETGSFQPVVSVPIKILETEDSGSWAYISMVGATDLPVNENSEIIACIDYVGEFSGSGDIFEPLAVDFEINTDSNEKSSERVYSTNTKYRDYLSIKPSIAASSFNLKTTLFQERSTSYVDTNKPQNSEDFFDENETNDNMVFVNKIDQSFACTLIDCNNKSLATYQTENLEVVAKQSKWFYVAIILAALLLMYLMLGRLNTSDEYKPTDLSSDEIK